MSTVAAAVPMAPPAATSAICKVVFRVAPLLVNKPLPAALPKVWLALRTVNVPVVAPMLIDVPAWYSVIVVALVLKTDRVVALVAIVALFRLIIVAASVALALIRDKLLAPPVRAVVDDALLEPRVMP